MTKKIKIDEKTAWKNRWLIMISKTSINQIDCMKYQNKMNNAFKNVNIHDVLIITTELSQTKNFIIFTMIEKNTANQLINHRKIWKKNFSIFNHTHRWNMTKIFDTWNWNDHFRKFDWHKIVSIWNWNIQSKRNVDPRTSMID